MKSAVIVFPGSNCDRDLAVALTRAAGREAQMVWHKDATLPDGLDMIAIPGGFSFGDYLRCGAIAARAPIMRAVIDFANRGGLVLGVCNGFHVLIESGLLRRVLAMTELRFSNSMIEAWWRALKHQWLFLNTLDSVETIERLVRFYVKEHNERRPHSVFKGQTSDEMYFGKGDDVPDGLESGRKAARKERLAVNRALACAVCEASPDSDAA